MNIIKDKYNQLTPKGSLLRDVVILAQAWKKTHTAIRRHNWYVDALELDTSTIDLERNLAKWAHDIEQEDFAPDAMLLVPAPKNTRWEFPEPQFSGVEDMLLSEIKGPEDDAPFEAWGVAQNQLGDQIKKLRPLAHLAIRDQTLATAVMLCLAGSARTSPRRSLQIDQSKTPHMADRTGTE